MPPRPKSTRKRRSAKSRKPAREIDVLSPEEVRALLDLCSRRSPTGVRNRALIAVLYGAGLRIAEALALMPKDVHLDDPPSIRVHRGKGNKPRTCALLPASVEFLQRWLDKRTALGVNGRRPIFCTLTKGTAGTAETQPGQPLSSAYVRGWLARLASKARTRGIDKRIHAHGFRHSHAHQLRKEGWDMHLIQKQLGHSSLSVTGQYLDHIGAHELSDRMRGADWGL